MRRGRLDVRPSDRRRPAWVEWSEKEKGEEARVRPLASGGKSGIHTRSMPYMRRRKEPERTSDPMILIVPTLFAAKWLQNVCYHEAKI